MTDARAMPGVVAVYSADDLDFPDHGGMMQLHPAAIRHSLARGKVRYVGDTVAVVVAETKAQAVDAAEAVVVDYDMLPAVADMESAMAPDSPRQFDAMSSNIIIGAREPDGYDALAGADVIVRGRFENQRLAVVPMEGAAIAVIPGDDGDGHQLTVYLGCQMPHMNRGGLAAGFGLEPESVRLIAPHVGGSFGGEALGARGRRRGEGRARARPTGEVDRDPLREHDLHAPRARSGAVPRDGAAQRRHHRRPALPHRRRRRRVRRLRRDVGVRPDAHDVAGRVPHPQDRVRRRGRGHEPRADGRVPRRGSSGSGGDARAHPRHGRGRAGHRPRRHPTPQLPRPDEFPYTTVTGVTYDVGDYDAALDRGVAHRRVRRAARRAGGPARARRHRAARHRDLRLRRDHRRWLRQRVLGGRDPRRRHGHGQGGHVGTRAGPRHRVLAAGVGRAGHPDRVDRVHPVRHRARAAWWWHRWFPLAAARGERWRSRRHATCCEQARSLAAELLEAAPEDIVLSTEGTFGVAGVPSKSVTWAEVATASEAKGAPLAAEHDFVQDGRIVPVRRARVGRRGRHARPGGSYPSVTSRSTTAVAS